MLQYFLFSCRPAAPAVNSQHQSIQQQVCPAIQFVVHEIRQHQGDAADGCHQKGPGMLLLERHRQRIRCAVDALQTLQTGVLQSRFRQKGIPRLFSHRRGIRIKLIRTGEDLAIRFPQPFGANRLTLCPGGPIHLNLKNAHCTSAWECRIGTACLGRVYGSRSAAAVLFGIVSIPQRQQDMAVGGHIDSSLAVAGIPVRKSCLRRRAHKCLASGQKLPKMFLLRSLKIRCIFPGLHGQGAEQMHPQFQSHFGTKCIPAGSKGAEHPKAAVWEAFQQLD